MKKIKSEEDLNKHKKHALSSLELLIDKYISGDNAAKKKADLLSYWISDYTKFLESEEDFEPKKLRRYKRGEIIKAHLGYRIGSEEGGLHYCLVMDKKNLLSSPVITVVPLTSVKEHKDITRLKNGEVFLGSDLKDKMNLKLNQFISTFNSELKEVLNEMLVADSEDNNNISEKEYNERLQRLHNIAEKNIIIKNLRSELQHMKNGSIALLNQITTISKIRIYEPKTNKDPLANIKLSNEMLDKIDSEMKNLFIH